METRRRDKKRRRGGHQRHPSVHTSSYGERSKGRYAEQRKIKVQRKKVGMIIKENLTRNKPRSIQAFINS